MKIDISKYSVMCVKHQTVQQPRNGNVFSSCDQKRLEPTVSKGDITLYKRMIFAEGHFKAQKTRWLASTIPKNRLWATHAMSLNFYGKTNRKKDTTYPMSLNRAGLACTMSINFYGIKTQRIWSKIYLFSYVDQCNVNELIQTYFQHQVPLFLDKFSKTGTK